MPRVTDPSTLTRGGGLSARRSVEVTSFVHPTQGLDGTIAHILDPRRAHMAEAIGVEDVAGNFASDEVEGALAELAVGGGATEQNGVYQGCTYAAVGLVVTLANPSLVVINGTLRDMAGQSLTLTAGGGAVVNWLYVHGTTGLLSKAIGAAPTISNPEHVLLARIVVNGGAIVASRDARWFVRNNNRKLPVTVRSIGTEEDRNSEGACESIDAAILYLENYGNSGVIRNTTIILKGPQTITATVVIPLDGVTLQGEDGCTLTTAAGGGVTLMIDVSGRSSISIRDITFQTDTVPSTAIGCPSNGVLTKIYVERCVFSSGAQDWGTGIDFNVAGPQNQVVVRDCNITATTCGIRMREPVDCRVLDTVITELGGAGTLGFHLGRLGGAIGNTVDSTARGVRVTGFATGAFLRGLRMRMEGCDLGDCDTGLNIDAGSSDVTVSESSIRLDVTNGLIGVDITGSQVRIVGTRITNQRTAIAYAAEVPIGIRVATGSDFITVTGTLVSNFLNSVTPSGSGILTMGATVDFVVDGCQVTGAYRGIVTAVATNVAITGTTVRDVDIGIIIGGPGSIITGGSVTASTDRGVTGISVENSDTVITGCTIASARNVFTGETPVGINIGSSNVKVSNCIVRGWQNAAGSLGVGIRTAAGAAQITIDATTIVGCWSGFVTLSAVAADEVTLSGCTFRNIDQDAVYFSNSNRVRVSDCTLINPGSTDAVYFENGTDIEVVNCKVYGNSGTVSGIHLVGADVAADRVRRFVISGNNISEVTGDGILLEGYVQNGVVSNNQVDCFLPAAPSDPTALACIRLASTGTTALIKYVEVTNNVCQRAQNGIVVAGNSIANMAQAVSVGDNTIHHCAVGSAGSTTCAGIDTQFVRDLAISGCTVSNIGLLINNIDTESPPTAGANVNPYGIRVRNSTQVIVSDCGVSNSIFAGGGTSYGITYTIASAGAVLNARSVSITGCRVTTTDAIGTPHNYGIFVQCGEDAGFVSTLLGLTVTGCTVRRTAQFGISVTAVGGNTIQQASISECTVSQCLDVAFGFGIFVEARMSAGALADGVLREAVVTGCNVGDTGSHGILVASGDGCSLTDVAVRDCAVANAGDRGIYVYGGLTPAAFGQFLIDGNTITETANEGILIASQDFDMDDITVTGNTVMGASGMGASGMGIRILTAATGVGADRVSMDRLTVSGNKVNTRTSRCVSIDLEGTLSGAVISGNVLETNTPTASPLFINLDTPADLPPDTYSENINVFGNTFVGGQPVAVSLDHQQKIRNFNFSNNVRQNAADQGFTFDIVNANSGSGEAVLGLTVSGNTFSEVEKQAVRIFLGDTVTALDTCSNISVRDNHFHHCATDGTDNVAVRVRCFARVQNLFVTGNDFKTVGTLDNIVTGNVFLQIGSGGSTNAGENVNVSGNSFNGCYGVAILIEAHSDATEWTLVNLKVEGNSVQEQLNDAIRVNLSNFTTARAISVSDNTIDNIGVVDGVTAASSDMGIRIVGPTAAPLNQLSICRNTIRNTGDANLGAIYVSSADNVDGLVIDGNNLQGTKALLSGIHVNFDGVWEGGSVSGNTIDAPTVGDGISVSVRGVKAVSILKGVSFVGNTIVDVIDDCIFIEHQDGATLEGVTISSNTFSNPGSAGFYLNGEGGGGVAGLNVTGNTIYSPGSHGIYLNSTDQLIDTLSVTGNVIYEAGGQGIYVYVGSLRAIAINENTIKDPDEHGIYVHATEGVHGASISGNTLLGWGVVSGGRGIYFYAGTADITEAEAVSVCNNTLYCQRDDSTGLYFSVLSTIRTFNVSGNIVRMTSGTGTRSMLFGTGTTAVQQHMYFGGNSFYGAETGVSASGDLNGRHSVVSQNNERTLVTGSGNWGIFAAGPHFHFPSCILGPNQDS